MNLKVLSIKDKGNITKERVVLKVMSKMNIGQFAIACTEFDQGTNLFSPDLVGIVWFPDIKVEKDDFIVVYTKKGKPARSIGEYRITTHFFYFNQDSPIWKSGVNGVVLLNIADWQLINPNEIKK